MTGVHLLIGLIVAVVLVEFVFPVPWTECTRHDWAPDVSRIGLRCRRCRQRPTGGQ